MSTIDDLAADLKALKRLARILDELTRQGLDSAAILLAEAQQRRDTKASA